MLELHGHVLHLRHRPWHVSVDLVSVSHVIHKVVAILEKAPRDFQIHGRVLHLKHLRCHVNVSHVMHQMTGIVEVLGGGY